MNKYRYILLSLGILLISALTAVSSYAQTTLTGSLQVIDQLSLDGAVTVPSVTASDPVFVVIHADDGSGSIGDVIGQMYLNEGEYQDVRIPIDPTRATSTLYAVLYIDDNEIGVYEFGAVDGADEPLMVDGEMVAEPFKTNILSARDQITDDVATIDFVTVAEPGWIVIHSGDAQNFGDAIGQTFVEAGTTTNVSVAIDPQARTNILWLMFHQDTGAKGEFEFGSVEGADLPLVINDRVATLPFSSAPIIRAGADTITLNANGVLASNTATLTVGSALSDGPGFLVVHNDSDGEPGDMIGFTPVTHGLNRNVTVEVDAAMITPNLWLMLHKDDNVEGEFEFGSVEDADSPVMVDNQVVTFAAPVSPFIEFSDQTITDNAITIDRVWYNNPGFVVIYADNGHGGAGKVIGQTAIQPGLNTNVVVELIADDIATGTIFPILHEDTGEVGVYEFRSVDDVDLPVRLNNRAVAGELALTVEINEMAEGVCTATPVSAEANLRSDPSVESDIVGSLTTGQSLAVQSQVSARDGFTWYELDLDTWARSDVVTLQGDCESFGQ